MTLRAVVVAGAISTACSGSSVSSTTQEIVTVLDSSSPIADYSFGTVASPVTHMFEIGPASATDDDFLTSIEFQNLCPDFSIDHDTINNQELCLDSSGDGTSACQVFPFSVTFAPMAPGMQSCNILIDTTNSDGSSELAFEVSGTGAAAIHQIALNPTAIDFGSVIINTSSGSQAFTIANTGTQSVTFGVTPAMDVAPFVFTPPLPSTVTLTAGESFNSSVTCHPTVAAPAAQTYAFASNDVSAQLALSCTGINIPLVAGPNPIDFGKVVIGNAVAPITVTLSNVGNAGDLVITNIGLSSDANPELSLATPSSITIPSGNVDSEIVISYAASHPQDPGRLGTLMLTVAGEQLDFPITGAALVAAIGTNPASIDFGAVCADRSTEQDVEVYASGRADVTLGIPTPPDAPFGATLSANIVHGGHQDASNLAITVAPAASDLGPLSSQVVLATSIPGQPDHVLDVKAIGVPPGVIATPASTDFGVIRTDTTSTAKRIDFSNCSGTSVMVTTATISGVDAGSFTLVSPTSDVIAQSLDDAQTETFLVVMSPHTRGTMTAQLDITASNGVTSIPLVGMASEPTVDRETYYACATGRAASAWPIVAALAMIVRRRRRVTAGRRD